MKYILLIYHDEQAFHGSTEDEHQKIYAEYRQRSEEHTSELQSPCNLVCRLLLEKKKTNLNIRPHVSCITWQKSLQIKMLTTSNTTPSDFALSFRDVHVLRPYVSGSRALYTYCAS